MLGAMDDVSAKGGTKRETNKMRGIGIANRKESKGGNIRSVLDGTNLGSVDRMSDDVSAEPESAFSSSGGLVRLARRTPNAIPSNT